jgi:hypothetical protein
MVLFKRIAPVPHLYDRGKLKKGIILNKIYIPLFI